MNQYSLKTGSMMLIVVLLMSIVLVLCTRMWRSTAYVLDIAIQKQIHMQKKWATQGILNCAVAACHRDFKAIHTYVTEQGGNVSMPLHSYALQDSACLAHYIPMVTLRVVDEVTLHILAGLYQEGKQIFESSCDVCKTTIVA